MQRPAFVGNTDLFPDKTVALSPLSEALMAAAVLAAAQECIAFLRYAVHAVISHPNIVLRVL